MQPDGLSCSPIVNFLLGFVEPRQLLFFSGLGGDRVFIWCLLPFGTERHDRLLFSTMFPEVFYHFTLCTCLVVPSSIPNIFRYGVMSFIPVRMYYLFFVGSCLFL